MKNKTSCVYQIVNKVNGKIYIGSTINARSRFCTHKRHLERGIHHSSKLQNAWNKYGSDAFVFNILEMVDVADLQAREQFYLDSLRPHEDGYNMSPSAYSLRGFRQPAWTAERRKASGDFHRGNKYSVGRVLGEETRKKISESKRGKKMQEVYRLKMIGRDIGESNPLSKLTEAQVRAIKSDPRPRRTISKDYGVCATTILNIQNGRAWRHVQVEVPA